MRGSKRYRPLALLTILSMIVSALAVFGATAAVTAQDATAPAGEPVSGGTFRMAISEEPDQLDPARTIELLASDIMQGIYDALVYIGDDGLPHPWVAESWTIAPDGKVITFKIRQGIKFHDGTTLDAAAVKASYDRILDPAMAAPYKSFLGTLTTVDAPDATTAVFNFSEPYAPFFTNGGTIGIVSPAGVAQFGDDFGHNPAGAGPF